jgi:hypothetical protein
MRAHKYHAGQVVNLPGGTTRMVPSGRYEIVRNLPERDSQPQYRVKALLDGTEWVLKESDLE